MLQEMIGHKDTTEESESQMEWGVGRVQNRQKEEKLQKMLDEADQPFARMADDPILDSYYRQIDRWGDPMAALLQKEVHHTLAQVEGEKETRGGNRHTVLTNISFCFECC